MLLPSVYFGPIFYYSLLIKNPNYELEVKEHFIKQSYRSRCEIYGANGKLKLIVPLKKWRNQTSIEETGISNEESWQINHWKSICSAYRCSPYFEFYEEELYEIFVKKFHSLIDLNSFIETKIAKLLKVNFSYTKTEKYRLIEEKTGDYRRLIHPKNDQFWSTIAFPKYIQVFANKHGYIKNLSILDLLFNLGPNSLTYLENIAIKDDRKD